MRLALQQARRGAALGEVPVGAVLVAPDGAAVLAAAHNRVHTRRSPLAHAEMLCLAAGAARARAWRLLGTTLYVTLEPCPMCAGALMQARVGRVVYGARQPRLGADGSWVQLFPPRRPGRQQQQQQQHHHHHHHQQQQQQQQHVGPQRAGQAGQRAARQAAGAGQRSGAGGGRLPAHGGGGASSAGQSGTGNAAASERAEGFAPGFSAAPQAAGSQGHAEAGAAAGAHTAHTIVQLAGGAGGAPEPTAIPDGSPCNNPGCTCQAGPIAALYGPEQTTAVGAPPARLPQTLGMGVAATATATGDAELAATHGTLSAAAASGHSHAAPTEAASPDSTGSVVAVRAAASAAGPAAHAEVPPHPFHDSIVVEGGCLAEECGELVRAFFRRRRREAAEAARYAGGRGESGSA
ncbi:hypothetical protein HYH02_011563 [Chlamydomonas schloesseri]|uniref:CMP/dCMP-type deaminase domain-containing protein n=1 Tax=Chlamydomonas schloesseri TaxID=2026947 RepID=A0A835T0L7_9CHLO|nr:hypothetical protein HYH02_011563 [Chlamydomonas schloesseri]|eukprot:KAG2436628.1 hypothetical protein HYH02_011563 [Chlamydomonas schloesseri]